MEMYIEQGESRLDCELKITEKYRKPFRILSEKEIRMGGFLGFFSKPGVQVEYYFTPQLYKTPAPPLGAPWHAAELQGSLLSRQPLDLEDEKRKVLAAAGKNYDQIAANGKEASQAILDTLNELKEKIDNGITVQGANNNEHPSIVKAAELLKENDFSDNYIKIMTDKIKKELSLEKLDNFDEVQDHLLEWIGESINIYKDEDINEKPRVVVLIGPAGVGKTTTVAKLAACYGIKRDDYNALDVRMITIDAYRMGAKEQLKATGDIMRIPVTAVMDKQSLRREIAIHNDIDMFLIDTIGRSPKDAAEIGKMKEILDGAGRTAEFFLVLSAATKTSSLENIMRQFEPFNYKSVLLTKMDETDRVGNIISVLAEKKKPVSYITDGQTVPVDICRASVVRFLINLEGFKVDRDKIEKRFPSVESDNFKWR